VALLLRSAAREDESSGDPHTTRAGAPVPGAHQHNRAEGSLTRPSSSRGSNGQGPGSRAEAGFGPAAGAAAAVAEGLSGMGMEVGTQRDQGMEASSSSGGGSGSSGAPLCALPPAEQELDYPHLLNKVRTLVCVARSGACMHAFCTDASYEPFGVISPQA